MEISKSEKLNVNIQKASGMRVHKPKNIKPLRTRGEVSFHNVITSINKRINEMNDADYIKFRDHITRYLDGMTKQLKRDHFKDRDEYKKMRENRLSYLFRNLFEITQNIKLCVKEDYKYIINTYNGIGLDIMSRILNTIDGILVEKKYNPVDKQSIYNKDDFDNALQVLGLTSEKKLLFSEIKRKYNEQLEASKEDSELQEIINKSFILLRNQYDEYLQSFETQ